MNATITITKLYALLSEKIGNGAAENLTAYIETKVKNEVGDNISHLATKEDVERNAKEQLKWMIVLFIPLYLSIFGLIITLLLKH